MLKKWLDTSGSWVMLLYDNIFIYLHTYHLKMESFYSLIIVLLRATCFCTATPSANINQIKSLYLICSNRNSKLFLISKNNSTIIEGHNKTTSEWSEMKETEKNRPALILEHHSRK